MTVASVYCPNCNTTILDGARFCNNCGEKISEQNEFTLEPAADNLAAPEEYILTLTGIKDGCHEKVAKRLSELTNKDLQTANTYLNKLPLTLGRKFTREKAATFKDYFDVAGASVECTPSSPTNEATRPEKEHQPRQSAANSHAAFKPSTTHSSSDGTKRSACNLDASNDATDKISPKKVLWYTLFTLGLYPLYWFYRTWVVIKKKSNADFSPGLRTAGLLVPLYHFLLIERMFTKDIELLRAKSGGAEMMKNRRIYVLSFVLYFLYVGTRLTSDTALPDLSTQKGILEAVFRLLPLYLVGMVVYNAQQAMNSYLMILGDKANLSEKWSLKDIALCSVIPAWIAIGMITGGADPHVIAAQTFYEQGKYDEAIRECKADVDGGNESKEAYHYLILSYEEKDDIDNALSAAQRYVEKYPDIADSHLCRGFAHVAKLHDTGSAKFADLAIQDASRVLSIDPNLNDAHCILGFAYLAKDSLQDSKWEFDTYLKSATEETTMKNSAQHTLDVVNYRIEADNYSNSGDFNSLLMLSDKFVEKYPDLGIGQLNKGLAILALGGNELMATVELEDAVRRLPNSIDAHYGLALAYFKRPTPLLSECKNELETCMQLEPTEPQATDIRNLLAEVDSRLGIQ